MQARYGLEMSDSCRSCKLRASDFFCEFSAADLKDFDSAKTLNVYATDAIIFREDELPRGVFVVCQGQIKLSIGSSAGRTLILRIAQPGEVLGLTATVSGNRYEMTAETLGPSQLAFLHRDDFLRFVRSHPTVYQKLLNIMASSYRDVCDQLRDISLASTSKRLARILLRWAEDIGPQNNPGCRVTIPVTREELGELIGSARETVTRVLSDLENRHLITICRATVTIRDRESLERIAAA